MEYTIPLTQLHMTMQTQIWLKCLNKCSLRFKRTLCLILKIFLKCLLLTAVSLQVCPVMSPRQKLKAIVNTAFALSDKIGGNGVERLEESLTQFNEWYLSKLEIREGLTISTEKRTHACMSQTSYTGSAKRVYNTHHIWAVKHPDWPIHIDQPARILHSWPYHQPDRFNPPVSANLPTFPCPHLPTCINFSMKHTLQHT